jgi:hypothetical protein
MNLKSSPGGMLYYRLISESGLVEMGVWPVMFGYRVRAGFAGSMFVALDWCAGGNWPDVERLYSLCRAILTRRPDDHSCFDGLPGSSQVKPFFRDRAFTDAVVREAGGDVELIRLGSVARPIAF